MQVLVLKQHSPNAPRLARLLGPEFQVSGAQTLPPDAEADVLVTTQLTPAEAATTRARLVHVPGAGFDGIAWADLPPGCRGANAFCHEIPMAEYVLFMALGHVLRPHRPQPLNAQTWAPAYMGRTFRGELYGATMTVIGTGHIGREIARRARSFGLTLQGVNRSGRAVADFDRIFPVEHLDDALPNTDILIICCPLNDTTRNLIDARRLARLPRHCQLINVARGPVVDARALADCLRTRGISEAVIDVWYQYPTGIDDRVAPAPIALDELDNLHMTPHVSGWSQGMIERRYQCVAENIQRLAAGEPLVNQIWPRPT